MPGAPLLISLNGTPRAASRLLDRQPVGHVVGRDEVERTSARPAHRASRSAGERSGGEITYRAHDAGSGSSYDLGQGEVVRAGLGVTRTPAALARRTSSSAAADDRWTTWTGASVARAKASARAVATAST